MKKLTKISTLLLLTGLLTTGCNDTPSINSSNSIPSISNSSINLEHKITYVENEYCTITLSKEVAKRDEKIVVTVSEIKEGYEVHKITANGYIIDNNEFIMPNEDVEVEVFLKQWSLGNDNETIRYNVKTVKNEYAVISTPSYYYAPGDLVEINYFCKGSYILDKFFVNEVAIEGTSFIMPEDNAVISGTFIKAINETPWQVSCTSSGVTANSFWYFEYAEDGLKINVKVQDNRVCGEEFVLPANSSNPVAWSDNVEIILDRKNSNTGYVKDQTFKILVDYLGNSQISYASSTTAWTGNKIYSSLVFNTTTSLKLLDNKDGYNGYEVNMFVSYSMFNLNYADALNNLTACIAMRNTTTYGGSGSNWNCYNGDINIWKNCYNLPVILENNNLESR